MDPYLEPDGHFSTFPLTAHVITFVFHLDTEGHGQPCQGRGGFVAVNAEKHPFAWK